MKSPEARQSRDWIGKRHREGKSIDVTIISDVSDVGGSPPEDVESSQRSILSIEYLDRNPEEKKKSQIRVYC